ncbi:ABC-2 type transport system permease protein [Bacillus sp. RC252]
MLLKQLKLHMKFHYKAILIFWCVALFIKWTTTATDIKGLKVAFLHDIFNNSSIAITIFIVASVFLVQDDIFRTVVSFGVTRLQFFIGSVCFIILQSVIFSFLQVLLLQGTFYETKHINLGAHTIEQFFAQFVFYLLLASLFQLTTIFQKRFNWLGFVFSVIFLFGLASTMYAGIGIKELVFIDSKMLLEIPNFISVSIVLILIYIVISALFIRKVSFEDTI